MKVGVFLRDISPPAGGGFTFQDDIFRALVRFETKHTAFVFSSLAKKQTEGLAGEHIRFVSSRRGLVERARRKAIRTAATVVERLPRIRNHFRIRPVPWLKEITNDLGIEFMWFLTPDYADVDVPYVFTVWDLQHRLQPWFPEVSSGGEWVSREQMYAVGIPRASAVIVGVEAGKAEITRFYRIPSERVKLIPHPTPDFALNAPKDNGKEALAKYHIPEGYLFYPAQFWPHKNHVALLLAVNLLRERYGLVFPVVFVGSDRGNLHYVQRLVTELGLSAYVHFLGFIPQKDLVGLYRNAFALAYMTFFGPENLPPLEAFALGCPVIASAVPGAQEQLGNAALLVDPRDEEQIAETIRLLYGDPSLRQTLVQRGLERAGKWTADDYVRSVFAILESFEPIRRCWDS